mmetsp:Transcript_12759/g.21539  ORF Transcript_12759/g.21539 Transcript_12759/m.21539 type:complete len:111 (+) Transcript_12759:742-1074(+)
MFLLLIIGYIFMFFYSLIVILIAILLLRRFRQRSSRIQTSQKILSQLSRVQFSEDLFGAIGDQNECIICMSPYGPQDMVSNLDCNKNHFFHTSCIEEWIKKGGGNCPICR